MSAFGGDPTGGDVLADPTGIEVADDPTGIEIVDDPRGGFVLALVILLLFGIGVAAAAGYQMVFSEALLSVHAKETQTALSIARAGLRSYIGKQVGVHDTLVTYPIEGGDAVLTARLVAEIDDFQTLYLLQSEGVYTDPTFTGSAARRTVYQYAVKREVALDHLAAFTQVTGDVLVDNNADVDGNDAASGGECEQNSVDIYAAMMGTGTLDIQSGNPLHGPDPEVLNVGSEAAVLDSLGIDWDLLTSTDFPVDFENTFPCSLPADSFPVIRFSGSVAVGSSTCGRGVLMVVGTLFIFNDFSWDGIILAGGIEALYFLGDVDYTVDGMMVTGLDGLGNDTFLDDDHEIQFDRCITFKAGKRLSHFQPVGSTWWEEM